MNIATLHEVHVSVKSFFLSLDLMRKKTPKSAAGVVPGLIASTCIYTPYRKS